MPKQVVDALAAAADIKIGLSDAELMRKYGVSAEGLQSLFRKLIASGIINAQDIKAPAGARSPNVAPQAPTFTDQDEVSLSDPRGQRCALVVSGDLKVIGSTRKAAAEFRLESLNCGEGFLAVELSSMINPAVVIAELGLCEEGDIASLRDRHPEAVIIALVDPDCSSELARLYSLGIFGHVERPVNPELFPYIVRRAFEFSELCSRRTCPKPIEDSYKEQIAELSRDRGILNAVAASTEAVCLVACDLDRNVQVWNPGAERIVGVPAEFMIGSRITKIDPPDEFTRVIIEYLRKTAQSGNRPVQVHIRRIDREKRTFPMTVSLAPYTDGNGALKGVVAMGIDLSHETLHEPEHARSRRASGSEPPEFPSDS